MAYTTADRDAVKAAMLQIVTTGRAKDVRFTDGSGYTYTEATLPQMKLLLDLIERDIVATPIVGQPYRPLRAVLLTPRSGY